MRATHEGESPCDECGAPHGGDHDRGCPVGEELLSEEREDAYWDQKISDWKEGR